MINDQQIVVSKHTFFIKHTVNFFHMLNCDLNYFKSVDILSNFDEEWKSH